jgi:hypothetical protein
MRAKAGEAASKVADAAHQASGQAKQVASSLASDATKQAKGFLNMQVGAGADLVDHVVGSARAAAESLDQKAPQLAGLVRNAAERAEQFSDDLRDQTIDARRRLIRKKKRAQSACDELIDNVQAPQANSELYASGAGRVHPVIVGWSTRNRPA